MDMRRSIDAQSLFIETALDRSSFHGEAFGFFKSRLHKAKLVGWERTQT